MFWRLGFTNAWRNLSRSVLAIVSIALAAGFMTNAFFVQGYTQAKDEGFRSMIGGEISGYAFNFQGNTLSASEGWQYEQYLAGVEETDLAMMMPELLQGGYVATGSKPQPFTKADIATMEALPFVQTASSRYQLPAVIHASAASYAAPLRGRDLSADALNQVPIAEYIDDGRWFTEADDGEWVAVVHSNQHYPPGVRRVGIGDMLQIAVPRITQRAGEIGYNYADPLLIELRVIGVLDVPMRAGAQLGPGDIWIHQLYAQSEEIQVPLSTWKSIWEMAGGGEYEPRQVALRINDLSGLENTVRALEQTFPQYSFYSVQSLLRRTETNFRLENYEKVQFYDYFFVELLHSADEEQVIQTEDLRLPIALLMFINAALIIAANLLIMISERRREIGILKAVGARRSEITQMVLAEALLITILGCFSGFIVFRFRGILTQLTNSIGLFSVLGTALIELLQILSIAAVASILFGLMPALITANLSVRDVLQED